MQSKTQLCSWDNREIPQDQQQQEFLRREQQHQGEIPEQGQQQQEFLRREQQREIPGQEQHRGEVPEQEQQQQEIPQGEQQQQGVITGQEQLQREIPETGQQQQGDIPGEQIQDVQANNNEIADVPTLEPSHRVVNRARSVTRTARRPSSVSKSRRHSMYPVAGERVVYKEGDAENWTAAEVLGRGGKKTGKHKDYFNVRNDDLTENGVNFDKLEWKYDNVARTVAERSNNEIEECNVVLIPLREHGRPECLEAKKKELEGWKQFDAYEEVEDLGQDRLSNRWVMTEKGSKENPRVKARLVARGFEETIQIQSDAPTGSKETLHIIISVHCHSRMVNKV